MRLTKGWFIFGVLSASMVAPAAAAGPSACDVLSKADAEKLAGGPLGDPVKHESRPTDTNGDDHTTYCAWFAKGYEPKTAEKPADLGVSVQLHTMGKPADAKRFYENSADMAAEMVRQSVGKDAKVVTVAGLGEAAVLAPAGDMPTPFSVATVAFLKDRVMAQVQAWKKGGGADEIARTAAKQVAGPLALNANDMPDGSPAGAAAPAVPAAAAIAPDRRIEALDVLRGVALMGIFVMNVPGFSHSLFTPPPVPDGSLDAKLDFLREMLFAGKFNLIFGALFGVGFSLQLGRLAAARGELGASLLYARRLAVLLVIGLVHAGLMWSGDVLLVYAALGFVLLAVRRLPDTAIAAVVAVCLAFPAISDVARPYVFSHGTETIAAFEYAQFEADDDAAYGHGTLVDAVTETTRVFAWLLTTPLGQFTYLSFAVQMATGILLGFMVGRRGWMERLPELRVPLRRVHAASLAIAILAGVAWWLLGGRAEDSTGEPHLAAGLARTLGRAALSTFYAVTVLRLLELPWAQRLLRPFAYAGRMPLSNYLGQTVLASFIFYGWGLGWWGRTSTIVELVLPFALFLLLQLPLSAWWLSRFRFGPVEYVWRRLTYGKLRA